MPDNTTPGSRARSAAEVLARANGLQIEGELLDGDDERHQIPRPYGAPQPFPSGWWVAIAIPASPDLLTSSMVIGVSKETGEARVLGSASDEG